MTNNINNYKTVGKNVRKVDGIGLASGGHLFVADLADEDSLVAGILTSPHAHARIKKIDISKAKKLDGVHSVLYHGNVNRVPHTTAGQGYPEPSPYDTVMFDNKVRYVGDRVAAVAAETPAILKKALDLIDVEYEVLKPVFDPEEALAPGAPIIHDEEDAKVIIPVEYDKTRNLAAHVDTKVGDTEKAFEQADLVVEDRYTTHYANHCAIEPHISHAKLDPHGRLVITSSVLMLQENYPPFPLKSF
jgi:putative selenate reductase molybdopterin-binding subunit